MGRLQACMTRTPPDSSNRHAHISPLRHDLLRRHALTVEALVPVPQPVSLLQHRTSTQIDLRASKAQCTDSLLTAILMNLILHEEGMEVDEFLSFRCWLRLLVWMASELEATQVQTYFVPPLPTLATLAVHKFPSNRVDGDPDLVDTGH